MKSIQIPGISEKCCNMIESELNIQSTKIHVLETEILMEEINIQQSKELTDDPCNENPQRFGLKL